MNVMLLLITIHVMLLLIAVDVCYDIENHYLHDVQLELQYLTLLNLHTMMGTTL